MTGKLTYELRPFKPSDAEPAVALINAAARPVGIRRAVVDNVGNVRLTRYVPPGSRKVVVTTIENDIIGYAYLANKEDNIVYEVGGAVHPDYWGNGIGIMLLTWGEQQAHSLSARAPAGVKTVLQTNLFEAEKEAIQLFTFNKYEKVREWLHLEIELSSPPKIPPTPNGYILREIDFENDEEIIIPAMEEAFADHWRTIVFTEAPAFYTSLGMRWYRREYLFEKEIRPGTEIRRLDAFS